MTHLAGIIGYPVGHSVSPPIHQAAFDEAGLDARYMRWATPPASLPHRIESLRRRHCLGANVTVPHKIAALERVDEGGAARPLHRRDQHGRELRRPAHRTQTRTPTAW